MTADTGNPLMWSEYTTLNGFGWMAKFRSYITAHAFSEPFVVNKELFELIEGMESSLSAN